MINFQHKQNNTRRLQDIFYVMKSKLNRRVKIGDFALYIIHWTIKGHI